MQSRNVPILFAVTLALGACQRDAPTAAAVPAGPEPAAAATATATAVAAPSEMRLRGSMLMGKDGYGMTICGDTVQRIVRLDPGAQSFLDQFLVGGAHEFFVDSRARQNADASWEIHKFERVGGEGQGCAEAPADFAFKAHGTEPFWSITVSGNRLVFERPDVAALQTVFDGIEVEGEVRRIHADTAIGRIDLQLNRKPCSDGMSDTLFAWTAQLQLDAQTWQGCAYSGLP